MPQTLQRIDSQTIKKYYNSTMCDFFLTNKAVIRYMCLFMFLTKKLPLKVWCRVGIHYALYVPCGTRMNQYLPFALNTTLLVAIR